jgi:gamma-glutamyl hercynylcysteine S-oxide synthase
MHGKYGIESSINWRNADAAQIADGLQSLRYKTLALFDAYVAAGMLVVPIAAELNPPLWELGHLAWFQEFWIGRNQERDLGIHFDPNHTRFPSVLTQADSLYNSSTVQHASRWQSPLLAPHECKKYLAKTLNQTLELLAQAGNTDDALYFYRLVMFHEAMHLEAAIYMAQVLGVDISHQYAINSIAFQEINTPAKCQFNYQKLSIILGSQDSGFSFDNELNSHPIELSTFSIDSHCVNWINYLKFVETTTRSLPRYIRKGTLGYEQQVFGVWKALDLQNAAVHISLADAQEYCSWAGRRLPTEAEWELAASNTHANTSTTQFRWGEVWEWTSSKFEPYPGFVAHPYSDYSAPWFGTRQVLRGACTATEPMMKNTKYRNYFTPDRTDIFAGFRTCSL